MKVSGTDLKKDLIPTLISDDGKKRVIRYSLRNGSNPPQKANVNAQKKTIEFVDHPGFQPIENVIRAEAPRRVIGERSRSQYINNEPAERMVRTVLPDTYSKAQQQPKVINVAKSNYTPLTTHKRGTHLNHSH